jgi:uncharacterized protein (DUF302 family)
MRFGPRGRTLLALGLALAWPALGSHGADDPIRLVSRARFADVATALERAIAEANLTLVCHANAQRGAAARGVRIPGNQVLMVFRNDLAVRLLNADPAAGFEAPLRIYLHENPDGTATLTYRAPAVVFAPYRHPDVAAVARELDPLLRTIVDRALATP